ncbi:MAG TPA: prenyltransferase [Gammaproteobacteria bacterium]|nr:prenyltransferase [Gammaproteobacteria bacterium]
MITHNSNYFALIAHRMNLSDYIKIARPDHWFKNLFMLPGVALALVLADVAFSDALFPLIIAVASTCLVASANYVINEYLDAEFDRFHPVKKHRPSAVGQIRGGGVVFEYILLGGTGLWLATLLTPEFVLFSAILLVMGVLYNVRPFRTKEVVFLDVLSESINNPLRLLLGWSALVSGQLPPSSILLAYWMGGAFLMAMKRYAEYRFINDPQRASLYRASFKHYTEQSLLLSSFFYALSSVFFLGIFLIKYRIEFILSFPLIALLFTWYLAIAMKPFSSTQTPEKLYKEKLFVTYVAFLVAAIALLFMIDIPSLALFVEPLKY